MIGTASKKPLKPLIIDPERQAHNNLSHPSHFLIKLDFKFEDHNDNSFLILPIETLTKYMHQIVESCTRLRVMFVVHKDNAENRAPSIDAMLDKIVQFKAEKALLPKLMVVSTFHDIDRVLQAWRDGVQDNSIAEAWVDQSNLVIKTCAFERLEVGFDKVPWLSKLSARDRDKFDIDQFGRYIHWPIQDVHLNVDAVRCQIDKSFRTRRDIELLNQNREYGRAIAAFREDKGLSQLTIQETSRITERQLRRVEREGHSLSVKMAEQLAKAHGLSTNEYLNAIARIAQELTSRKPSAKRKRG